MNRPESRDEFVNRVAVSFIIEGMVEQAAFERAERIARIRDIEQKTKKAYAEKIFS
jgi:hypothetical protein